MSDKLRWVMHPTPVRCTYAYLHQHDTVRREQSVPAQAHAVQLAATSCRLCASAFPPGEWVSIARMAQRTV
jgi:hypothetical protein